MSIRLARSLLTALAIGGLVPGAGEAQAQAFDEAVGRLALEVAEALSIRSLGRVSAADVYVRPPFDDASRVVCPPLSRRLARALRSELPRAFDIKKLGRARLVQEPATGDGRFMLNVTWRALHDEETLEIAFELGDLSGDQVATMGGHSELVPMSELRDSERQCLAELDVINRVATAETELFVHRSADVFSAEIAMIRAGEKFRLLGRMPYTDGDWAVVKLLDGAADDPFAETVGFASVPPTRAEREAIAARKAEEEARARRAAEERAQAEEAARAEAEARRAAEERRAAAAAELERLRAERERLEADAERRRREAEARRAEEERQARETERREAEARRAAERQRQAEEASRQRQAGQGTVVGQWQCQGQENVDFTTVVQGAFQIQFQPNGSYSYGGQLTSFINNQMAGQAIVGEYGFYRFDGQSLNITPQGGLPVRPFTPYVMRVTGHTGDVFTMNSTTSNGQYRCQRVF